MSSRRSLREQGEDSLRVDRLELDRNIPGLLQLLDSEFTDVRFGAIQALGRLGDPRVGLALMERVGDSDRLNRCMTYEALGVLRLQAAEDLLLNALRDPDDWVRGAAAAALCRVGRVETLPRRRAALREVFEEDPELEVRVAAAESLVILGDKSVRSEIPALIKGLPWLRRSNPQVKRLKAAAGNEQPLTPYPYLWERLAPKRRSKA